MPPTAKQSLLYSQAVPVFYHGLPDDATMRSMGLTHLKVRVANPAKPRKTVLIKLLIDSGAAYSVVPATLLRQIGVKSHSSRTFLLADGSEITRRMGDAVFIVDGQRGASPVIFGEDDDSALLGIVSLEALGLMLDPMKRVLRPLPMILGAARLTVDVIPASLPDPRNQPPAHHGLIGTISLAERRDQ